MKRFTAAFLALILTFGSLCLPADLFDGLFMRAGAYTYGDYLYRVLDDGTVEITDYNGSASVLNIPGGIDGRLVTSIGNSAFYKCTSLTQITIPDSVTSIGSRAFESCTSLTQITIPDSVTSIGNNAFYKCTNLIEITIPNSVTSIGFYAFYYCTSLTEITIPDSVTSIGSRAFESCTNLAKITISDSVTSIGEYAFYKCTSLIEITIPDSVTSIGDRAFYYCTSLTSIDVSVGNKMFSSYGNVLYNKDKTILIKCPDRKKSIDILDSVTRIEDNAFYNCTSLTGITIPDSITIIGDSAFHSCTSLSKITIPDSVTSIGGSAFHSCTNLTEITIPDSVTSIGGSAFAGCTSLTEITIPDRVTSIENWAFSSCTSLTEITIPDSVTSIGNDAFYNCTSLAEITIPNSVTSIGYYVFLYCPNLTLICKEGSYAHTYAKDNNIPYRLTNADAPDELTIALDKDSYLYTGSEIKPAVTVTDGDIKLKENTDYTLSYRDNVNIGTGSVTVKFKGDYKSQKTVKFKITDVKVPEKPEEGDSLFIRVVDINGKEIKKFNYMYGIGLGETEKGYIILNNIDTGKSFSVFADGYYDHNIDLKQYEGTGTNVETIMLFKESDEPHKLQSAYVKLDGIRNILNQDQTILVNEDDADSYTKDIEFQFKVLGHEKYAICYNLCKKDEEGNKTKIGSAGKDGKLTVKANELEASNYYCVEVESADGKVTYTDLTMKVVRVKESDYGMFSISSGSLDFQIPADVPIIGGSKMSLGKASSPVKIKYHKDGTVQVAVGDTKNFVKKDDDLGEVKKFVNSAKLNVNIGDFKGSVEYKKIKKNAIVGRFLMFDNAKINLVGYGEGKVNSDGSVNLDVAIVLTFEAAGNISKSVLIGTMPVYMELGYDFAVHVTRDVEFDSMKGLSLKDWSDELTLDSSVNITPYISVGMKYFNAGLYGNINLKTRATLMSYVESKNGFNLITAGAEVGARADVGPFKAKVPIWKTDGDYVIYDCYKSSRLASFNAMQSMKTADNMAALFKMENYSLSTDIPEGSFSGGEVASNTVTEIINGCTANAGPQIISNGRTTLMLYLDKDSNRTDINSNVLMYSVYNESTDKWSEPQQVDGNELLDNRAHLYTDGDKIYLMYEEASGVLPDNATVEDFAASLEIVYARFNEETGSFENIEKLTDNGVMDSRPIITNTDGVLTAVWVSNDDPDYFGLNGTNKIMYSTNSGSGWSVPEVLAENLSCVTDLSAGMLSGKPVVSYITDSDNDLVTEGDKQLKICTSDGKNTLVCEGNADNVQFTVLPGTDSQSLTWYEDGFIKYLNSLTGDPDLVCEGADYSVGSDYIITGDKIYFISRNNDSTDLMLVNYEDGWSEPVSIAKSVSDSYFEQLSAAGDTAVMLKNKVEISDNDLNTQSDIVSYRYCGVTDLRVNKVYYDYEYAVPDYQMPLYISVTNAGTKTINGVRVNIYKGEESVYAKDISYVIRAGAEEEILVLLDTDENFYTGDYRISVQPLSSEDIKPDDNETVFSCGLADLEVNTSEFVAGNGGTVTVSVKNNSYIPVSGSKLSAEDENGNVLKTIEVPEISGGGIEVFNIPVSELLNDDDSEKFIRFNLITQADEYDIINNSAVENVKRYAASIETCSTEMSQTEFTYDSNAKTPTVTVKDGEKVLTENKDYSVEYSDNINAGTASVTVQGIGRYSESVTKSFKILRKKVGELSVTVEGNGFTYSGSPVAPEITVKDGDKTLSMGKDYYLVYSNNVNAGTANVTVVGTGNYIEAVTENFTISRRSVSSGLTFSYTQNCVYSGNAYCPAVTVKNGDTVLLRGSDYSVSYNSNINAGTANIIIRGLGNYTGTVIKSFVISPRSIASLDIGGIEDKYIYTGSPIVPSPTLKYGAEQLVRNTDFGVSYKLNTAIGKASVIITGKGNYMGTVTKTFEIVPKTPVFKEEYTSVTDAVRINWEKVDNATGYRIYRYNEKNKSWVNIQTISDNSVLTYRDEGLKPGTVYKYKVKAYKSINDVIYWGYASSEKPTATAPEKITFTKANRSTTSVRLFWDEVVCTGYKVQQYDTSSKEWKTVQLVPYGTAELKISGLKSSTQYKYRIQGYTKVPDSENKKGAWSDTFTVSTTS